MERIKVTSIQHLKELLDKGEAEFVVAAGAFRSSKHITADEDFVYILHYCDDTEDCLPWEQVSEPDSYLSEKIANGLFYCETNKDY